MRTSALATCLACSLLLSACGKKAAPVLTKEAVVKKYEALGIKPYLIDYAEKDAKGRMPRKYKETEGKYLQWLTVKAKEHGGELPAAFIEEEVRTHTYYRPDLACFAAGFLGGGFRSKTDLTPEQVILGLRARGAYQRATVTQDPMERVLSMGRGLADAVLSSSRNTLSKVVTQLEESKDRDVVAGAAAVLRGAARYPNVNENKKGGRELLAELVVEGLTARRSFESDLWKSLLASENLVEALLEELQGKTGAAVDATLTWILANYTDEMAPRIRNSAMDWLLKSPEATTRALAETLKARSQAPPQGATQ